MFIHECTSFCTAQNNACFSYIYSVSFFSSYVASFPGEVWKNWFLSKFWDSAMSANHDIVVICIQIGLLLRVLTQLIHEPTTLSMLPDLPCLIAQWSGNETTTLLIYIPSNSFSVLCHKLFFTWHSIYRYVLFTIYFDSCLSALLKMPFCKHSQFFIVCTLNCMHMHVPY